MSVAAGEGLEWVVRPPGGVVLRMVTLVPALTVALAINCGSSSTASEVGATVSVGIIGAQGTGWTN